MKLKLDENLGNRGAHLLREAGHDVATVVEQQLAGTPDRHLVNVCHQEGRALVTLDMGFSNPIIFPPDQHSGIAVLRLPKNSTDQDLHATLETLRSTLEHQSLQGRLWIVERNRVRQYSLPATNGN